jgi:hypothetical protein
VGSCRFFDFVRASINSNIGGYPCQHDSFVARKSTYLSTAHEFSKTITVCINISNGQFHKVEDTVKVVFRIGEQP